MTSSPAINIYITLYRVCLHHGFTLILPLVPNFQRSICGRTDLTWHLNKNGNKDPNHQPVQHRYQWSQPNVTLTCLG